MVVGFLTILTLIASFIAISCAIVLFQAIIECAYGECKNLVEDNNKQVNTKNNVKNKNSREKTVESIESPKDSIKLESVCDIESNNKNDDNVVTLDIS